MQSAKDGYYIILEFLKDYQVMSSQNLVFDFEHFKIAAKTLAIFHASSLIFKSQTGEKVSDCFGKILLETSYPDTEGNIRRRGVDCAINAFIGMIKIIPQYKNSPKLNEIIEKFPSTIRRIFDFVQPSKEYKNVVSHGDLWANNFMFKYDSENKPITCKLVDFQLARLSPPALDLVQFVHVNSTEEFRIKYLNDVINTYLSSLENELMRLQLDVSVLLSRSEILQSFNDYRLAGLIESALFGHLILVPSEISSRIMSSSDEYDNFICRSRIDVCLQAFRHVYYKTRMTEILCEIIENFVL